MINQGLNLEKEREEVSHEDWVFGATSPLCIASIPSSERFSHLPFGEVQKGREDMMDCATRGPINIFELKFNYLYANGKISAENVHFLKEAGYFDGEDITFSDAFIAIKSGTTREGNSLKAPLDAIHRYGLIPKRLLPLEKTMTFDEYHNAERITPEMENLGQQFLARFSLNYERVFAKDYEELLDTDVLNVAGHAWTNPNKDGEYPRTSLGFNHCFIVVRTPAYYAFDNYIDPVDGDFIKKLTADYQFLEYGYRAIITAQKVPIASTQTFLDRLVSAIIKFFKSCPQYAT